MIINNLLKSFLVFAFIGSSASVPDRPVKKTSDLETPGVISDYTPLSYNLDDVMPKNGEWFDYPNLQVIYSYTGNVPNTNLPFYAQIKFNQMDCIFEYKTYEEENNGNNICVYYKGTYTYRPADVYLRITNQGSVTLSETSGKENTNSISTSVEALIFSFGAEKSWSDSVSDGSSIGFSFTNETSIVNDEYTDKMMDLTVTVDVCVERYIEWDMRTSKYYDKGCFFWREVSNVCINVY